MKKKFFIKFIAKVVLPHHLEWFTHILGQIPFYRPSLSSSLTILSNLDLFPKIYQGGKGLVLIPYLDDLSTLEGYFGYFHITESTLLLGIKIPFSCAFTSMSSFLNWFDLGLNCNRKRIWFKLADFVLLLPALLQSFASEDFEVFASKMCIFYYRIE